MTIRPTRRSGLAAEAGVSFRTRRPTLPPVAGDAAPVPVQVDVRGVLRALSLLTGVMIVMGIVSRVASTTTTDFVGRDVLANMFALSGEGNMPTYYSSFLLAMAAAIAWVIARTKRQVNDRFQRAWLAISAVFVYLSVDEVAQIHERVATGVRRIVADSAVLHYAWVAPYALVVLAVIVTFVPFLLHLPRRTAGGMILAGALYVLGAMGLEVFEGVLDFEGHFFSVAMAALVTIEESLEMCSVVLFIGVLLDYLRRQLPDLHLDLSFIGGRSR